MSSPHAKLFLSSSYQLQPLDEAVLQQKPNINAVTTLEKVIEIQSTWGQVEGADLSLLRGRVCGCARAGVYLWVCLPSLTPCPSLFHRQTLELCAEVCHWSGPFLAGGPGW